MKNILGICFPCMQGEGTSDTLNTKIKLTIHSNSKCCNQTKTIEISNNHLEEFKTIVDDFLKKIEK
jgi:hypothetical protein